LNLVLEDTPIATIILKAVRAPIRRTTVAFDDPGARKLEKAPIAVTAYTFMPRIFSEASPPCSP